MSKYAITWGKHSLNAAQNFYNDCECGCGEGGGYTVLYKCKQTKALWCNRRRRGGRSKRNCAGDGKSVGTKRMWKCSIWCRNIMGKKKSVIFLSVLSFFVGVHASLIAYVHTHTHTHCSRSACAHLRLCAFLSIQFFS